MFVPLKDNTPLQVIRFQAVTATIIAMNVLAFLITGPLAGTEALMITAERFGVVPIELSHFPVGNAGLSSLSEPLTLITYQFLHGSWMHLLVNMAFLWVFSDNIEDAFGHAGFAVFYLFCGIFSALAHVAIAPESFVPLIGASGSVSGVLGAYILLYPKARVWVLLFLTFPVPLPAVWILGAWFLFQFYSLFVASPAEIAVAWWAHIGGFVAGFLFTLILRSKLLVRT